MGLNHVLYGVGNDVARRQRVEHALMAHGDAVVDSNRVKLGGIASQPLYFLAYQLPDLVQMGVAGHKLSE